MVKIIGKKTQTQIIDQCMQIGWLHEIKGQEYSVETETSLWQISQLPFEARPGEGNGTL